MPQSTRSPRRGFTLVELLVVIGIIGVLAALITVAAANAMRAAKEAAVKTEVQNLAAALGAYKAKYGAYPPLWDANSSPAHSAVEMHLKKAFPRITAAEITAIKNKNYTPDKALVFWLRGFSPDPTLPMSGAGTRTPFFEFDQTRGGAFDGNYRPNKMTQPYVYFDGTRTYTANALLYPATAGTNGQVGPYPGPSAQIQVLSAGLDDHWGATPKASFPAGPYVGNEADNIGSFSDKNMEDSMP